MSGNQICFAIHEQGTVTHEWRAGWAIGKLLGGKERSEDTGLPWPDAVNTADTLAGLSVPWPLCIFTRCEHSQIISSSLSPFTHIANVCVWGVSLCHWMTHGEKLSFFAVYFFQNDSFLASFLPSALFCDDRKDASIYCVFSTHCYSFWRLFSSPSKSLCSNTLGGDNLK